MSVVSLYYYLQVLKRVYVMESVDEAPVKVRLLTLAVLLLIAVMVVVLGCLLALLRGWIAWFYPGI